MAKMIDAPLSIINYPLLRFSLTLLLLLMLVFPNCKINIGLQILDKRPDGYHNLETVFFPVPLKDALEIIRNPEVDESGGAVFTQSGLLVAGDPGGNLCMKAWQLLKTDFPELPPLKMHLHKVIPMGAGLGGGSSDGAHALLLLNRHFNLQLTRDQLIQYALSLGSDCPFFILNEPCFATGRGEILEPVPVNLQGYHLLLINPGIHISTAWAFQQLHLKGTAGRSKGLASAIRQPVDQWPKLIENDFEPLVLEAHPELQELRTLLYQSGAQYAAMSGSGSTFYGIFPHTPPALSGIPEQWMVISLPL